MIWTLIAYGIQTLVSGVEDPTEFVDASLMHHLGEISGILFFLLGAITLVELVDAHGGFDIITSKITTLNKAKLIWILCLVNFFVSAALDNMTTIIIMAALLRKQIHE